MLILHILYHIRYTMYYILNVIFICHILHAHILDAIYYNTSYYMLTLQLPAALRLQVHKLKSTLGPTVHKYNLLWAIWRSRVSGTTAGTLQFLQELHHRLRGAAGTSVRPRTPAGGLGLLGSTWKARSQSVWAHVCVASVCICAIVHKIYIYMYALYIIQYIYMFIYMYICREKEKRERERESECVLSS